MHLRVDHTEFSFHSYFRDHWQSYLLWFLGILIFLAPHQFRGNKSKGLRRTRFYKNLSLILIVVTVLALIWGCIQTGPMYFFNGFFLYSIPYVLLLLIAWGISEHFAYINEKIPLCGLYGVAVLMPYLLEVPNSYSATPDDLKTFRTIEQHIVDVAQKPPRFLAFEEHDWSQAASVALALKRLDVEFRVDPNWVFLFGKRHSINGEILPGTSRDLEIWSIKRDSGSSDRNIDLSNGYHIKIGLPPLDPKGIEIVFNSDLERNNCLFFGFGFPITDDFCFTTSPHASLVLHRSITDVDPRVVISAFPFTISWAVEEQRLKVELKGTEIYETTVRGEENIEFSIPRSLWNRTATVFLAFVLPDAVSPKSYGLSDDSRRLGLGFRKIKIDTTTPRHASSESTAFLERH